MLATNMKQSFDGMRGENQFLRLVVMALAVCLLVVGFAAVTKDVVVTVVPPTLTEKAWVSKTEAGAEYTEAWALYIAMMIGNVTPSNASIVKDAIGPLLESSIYQDTMNVLDKQIHQIRQDRVTLSFEPQKVLRDSVNANKFFVTGRSIAEGPTGEKKRGNRTYELELQIKNYKPVLSWISTNSGNAKTQDIIEREEAKQKRLEERQARNKS